MLANINSVCKKILLSGPDNKKALVELGKILFALKRSWSIVLKKNTVKTTTSNLIANVINPQVSQATMAKRFGVSPVTISRIKQEVEGDPS